MASTGVALARENTAMRSCEFCAEQILAEAKKCKHCGEFVDQGISIGVGVIFALGLITACVLAGFQPAASDGVVAVGVWAIFVLLFARVLGPVLTGLRFGDALSVGVNGYRRVRRFFVERSFLPE